VEILPMASGTYAKRRHWGLLFTFLLIVLAPVAAVGYYVWEIAEDQFSSTTGFTVSAEEGGSATDILRGFNQIAGSGTTSDSDVLHEFIQSQNLVERVDAQMDLRAHYSQHWETDKLFSIWPDASIEDLVWFWGRIVRISYDQSTGLIEIQTLAFDPDYAQELAIAVVRESQAKVNALSNEARADATRFAEADVEEALERLKGAREALTAFRTRTNIVDPAADIQGRMGVMNNLQQQLAEALIEFDLLTQSVNNNDPRLAQAELRIEVIRERIQRERQNLTSGDASQSVDAGDYPELIAEFESLTVDREFAEETYRAALAALDVARANAARQSRYLATYVAPTLAQSSQYPQRYVILGLTALFLTLGWAIMALVYYSIRDRR